LSIREPAIIVRKVVTFPEHEEKINIKWTAIQLKNVNADVEILTILFYVECFILVRDSKFRNYMKARSYHNGGKISTYIKLEVSSAMQILIAVFLAVTACCLVDVHQLSAGTRYLRVSTH
jgi:hypothetical protein